MWRDRKIILSVFCGRQDRMQLLLRHLDVLHERGVLDEVHLWDYCKRDEDRLWLATIQGGPYKHFKGHTRWHSYYDHYRAMVADGGGAEHCDPFVLIKCDDDVVTIDVEHFTDLLDFRIDHPEYLLVFPNIVNNGVAAHLQQSNGVVPHDLMELEMPPGGLCGSLWDSGDKCIKLHEHFLSDPARFAYAGHHEIEPGMRVSINCFAVLPEHVEMVFDNEAGRDDEAYLTIVAPTRLGMRKAVFNGAYVAHLSFYRQEEQFRGEQLAKLLEGYRAHAPPSLA